MTLQLTEQPGRELAIIAAETAARTLADHADLVDRDGVFPEASVAALARTGLLNAVLPHHLGGMGLSTATLSEVARTLGRACGSTAMIWTMHQVQLACVARHIDAADAALAELFTLIVAGNGLIASVTSELGVGGNLRESRVPCHSEGGRVSFVKQAPTISYGLMADAFLITARRNSEAAASDQVLVLASRDQVELQDVGEWDVMGMRGTRSPGCRIAVDVPSAQVLSTPFAEVAAHTMVPLSHILWSAAWIGIAEEAARRATHRLRQNGRLGKQGAAPDLRLASIGQRLDALNGLLQSVIRGYEQLDETNTGIVTSDFAVEANSLKLAASTETVEIAETALEICGMQGYQERGVHSVARMLRDLYSARLMISNSRLQETNATAMLMRRYG
ncbi:acyl-CoA/acyl-ACP dehydrogenase [Streptomyces caniscabiei]|uniref:Acyl-CoA/acyl-ACP dehydrogenase n=1 Tax=Streptomyces caniscabiei TaxID=2746961 RepID=A0A927LBB6_9ACTN|nr:acyl-CoA dehydrogenase family protein [Streptomyces caniscabiei]MBD9725903.1 acyl-CoA/acyl-ACP dehydrogenase [Streptomyces caniscabiei]MDX3507621.1 acyl-CoA/acyl-ACP dehydrogenase [Streptomyces caniscabiei]MDX3717583.1 acyl-CoA/acyl-ACP dehydrogenase [Streptomyces caniscabiei]WEO25335.1 acyl-CoA/acyl-ACP dehydrogenase [Streptomyces caniscabiei]